MITKKELIGRCAKISYNGKVFEGHIIDETKNMIWLETNAKLIKIIKKNSIIQVNNEIIKGKDIAKRPEERIKAC